MELALKGLFILILLKMAIDDFKTHTVSFKLSALEFLIALSLAILHRVSILQILVSSIWLGLLFAVTECVYQYIRNKNNAEYSTGIGFGDVAISPALTLFTVGRNFEMVVLSLGLSLVFNVITRNNRLPLIPFFLAGTLIVSVVFR